MENFKIGDIVARKSYNFDILFKVIAVSNNIVDLVGLTVRIIADAPEYDLKHISSLEVEKMMKNIETSRKMRLDRCYSNLNKKYNMRDFNANLDNPNVYIKDTVLKKPGIILHIDGDTYLSNQKIVIPILVD